MCSVDGILGPFIKDVRMEGEGGWPKSRHSKGGCVDFQSIQILDKGRGSKNPKILRTSFMNGPVWQIVANMYRDGLVGAPAPPGSVNMRRKNCVLLLACSFSPHIHRTWGPPFGRSLYDVESGWIQLYKFLTRGHCSEGAKLSVFVARLRYKLRQIFTLAKVYIINDSWYNPAPHPCNMY